MHNHKNRRELKLLKADRPEMLIETDITYIPTNNAMTYLMCIKNVFSKEWYGYNYNTSCTAKDAINAIDDAIIRKFNGIIPDNITLRIENFQYHHFPLMFPLYVFMVNSHCLKIVIELFRYVLGTIICP